ncbi:amino acid ABC transporter permease [Bordetella bronchiseptica]|uniref:amino acid ABC transporter permease n=1 Tax=Bordetella bronchiseptica TaxID=518 RepID=UPI00045BA063|nr:ABC transporter permease subunit [Bordetella bronchiseptica]AOB26062.1 amino acid ABC transporter permease [Bordetella bronchiseptica]AZW43346.1 amino acid ABC transporter permease [Bordetella bronchiseptica]KCV67025.1 ABC transporter, permease protein [Bordetella bronchiseptica 99-R-0433]MBN3268787.1 amino acid ABC transporter permease [Bordetella bronchiseptica]
MQDSTIALKRPGKRAARPLLSWLHDRKVRGLLLQLLLAAALLWLGYVGVSNAVANLKAANIASGFGFLANTAGFDINQSLIPYGGATSTYGDAFVVGLLNTLLVAAIGIVLATLIGFVVGIARLSSNVVVAAVATLYVETLRNLPLLLQIFFWYSAVLVALPAARESLHLADWVFLNNRGLYLPFVNIDGPAWPLWLVLALAVLGYVLARRLALRARLRGGRPYPARAMALALFAAVLGAGLLAADPAATLELPRFRGFGFSGGLRIYPEMVALVVALSTYTAAFIAEIVRAGIGAVGQGQREAAVALGLSPRQTQSLVITPQALRVIIPPLTSQFLNLTKNSSLAVAIAYPDLVQVFMGTVLNQTGRAVEIVSITMAVYLAISLVTSALMGVYNRRVRLVER